MARDGRVPAAQALAEARIAPLTLRPKEGLAVMNGTAVMTALACLAYARAEYLVRLATRITALASFALDGNAASFRRSAIRSQTARRPQQVARGCAKICNAVSRRPMASGCRIVIPSAARPM